MKALYLYWGIAPHIAPALQELIGKRETEVLPNLQSLFLKELHLSRAVQGAIEEFTAARQRAGHPIAVSHRD
jgi:hypothetical protein